MKKYLLLVSAAILFITANAQSKNHNNIPLAVSTAFAVKYPNVQVKKWTSEKNDFLAVFSDGKHKHTAYYDANGSWLKTDTKHAFTYSLPDAVQKKMKNCYFATWYIESIHEIEASNEHDYVLLVDSINPGDNENIGSQRQIYVTISPYGKITNMNEINKDDWK